MGRIAGWGTLLASLTEIEEGPRGGGLDLTTLTDVVDDVKLKTEDAKTSMGASLEAALASEEAQKEISRATFFRGINELKKAKLLASSTVEAVYWINASYVLRGNRLTLVNQYELEIKEEREERLQAIGTRKKSKGSGKKADTEGAEESGASI